MNKGDIYNQPFNDLALSDDRDGGIHDLITTNAYEQAKESGRRLFSCTTPARKVL
jgi:hypothetical protein